MDTLNNTQEQAKVAWDAQGQLNSSTDPWRDFLAPQTGGDFLAGWLAVTSQRIVGCRAAALLLQGETGVMGFAAGWQLDDDLRSEIAPIADRVVRSPEPQVQTVGSDTYLGYPIEQGTNVVAVVVFILGKPPGSGLRDILREIHWAAGWIDARLWQSQAAEGVGRAQTARLVFDLLAAANEHERFDGSVLALVNAFPELTGFETAAVAMRRGNRLRLEALSRDAGFSKNAKLTRAHEAAMAEAMDQGATVVFPARPDGRNMISLAHATLAKQVGAAVMVSVPLRVQGRVEGVLMVSRRGNSDQLFALDQNGVADLELAAAAIAPGLQLRYQQRRWISGRGRDLAGRAATAVLGRRPALTLGFLAALGVIAALVMVPVELRVRADVTLRGGTQQSVTAPQSGFIAEAAVKAGDRVAQGQLVARLDGQELEIEQAAAISRVAKADQDWRTATASGQRSEAAIAAAALREAQAQLDLVETRLSRLSITAAQAGFVVSGDLSQSIGAPVSAGDPLFEIATTDTYRLFIEVSEFDLELVRPEQTGSAVFSGLASKRLPFVVTSIASVSNPAEGENRFRVEADIPASADLRPGLTGTAKISTGNTRLGWSLVRGSVVRLRLWTWRFWP